MQEDIQQKYMEMQLMSQQMQQMEEQVGKIDEQVQELKIMVDAVENFKKVKKGDEMFASLTPGIFVRAKIEDSEKLTVNVGAGVSVEKTPDETLEILNKQVQDVHEFREQMLAQMQEFNNYALNIRKELQAMSSMEQEKKEVKPKKRLDK